MTDQLPALTAACADCGPPAAARFRVGLHYAIEGDLRYISHRDEMRMLARAIIRADWPLRYSQGFNPLPRIVLPLPRSVGAASLCQWALVDLSAPRGAEELCARLASELPVGCRLQRLIAPAPGQTPQPRRVVYDVPLERNEADLVRARLAELAAAERVVVLREHGPKRPTSVLDIQPYIDEVKLIGTVLRATLGFVEQRSARPTEILTALGLDAGKYKHRVCRREIQWHIELAGPTARPAAPERTSLERATASTAPDTG